MHNILSYTHIISYVCIHIIPTNKLAECNTIEMVIHKLSHYMQL